MGAYLLRQVLAGRAVEEGAVESTIHAARCRKMRGCSQLLGWKRSQLLGLKQVAFARVRPRIADRAARVEIIAGFGSLAEFAVRSPVPVPVHLAKTPVGSEALKSDHAAAFAVDPSHLPV